MMYCITNAMEAANENGFRFAITTVAQDATTTGSSSDDVIVSNQATLSGKLL
jgi:hypothetical protein